MLDRREFLKRCYKIGGIAAIIGMGLGAVEDAMGWGIMPAVVGSGSLSPWATWDEVTESGWGDSDNAFICLFEGGASANEIGQGVGISEVNRTLTQVGSIAAATGSPPTRYLDGANDCFSVTSAFCDALFMSDTWTVIIKAYTYTTGAGFAFNIVGDHAGTSNEWISISKSAADKITINVQENGSTESATTVNALPTTGTYYLAIWADGINPVRGGFSATKPLKWSQFGDNGAQLASLKGDSFAAGDFSDIGRKFFSYYNATTPMECYAYYVIVSKTCLINNAA